MAKTKTKKKYVPKLVRLPSLVTHLFSFGAFEAALDKVIQTGEVRLDEVGVPVYTDNSGRQLSFRDTLRTYIDIVDLHSRRVKVQINLNSMKKLMDRLGELKVIDEEEVDQAQHDMDICKRVIATIKPSELMDIVRTLRTRAAMTHIPD